MTNVSPYKLEIIVFVDLEDRSGRKQVSTKIILMRSSYSSLFGSGGFLVGYFGKDMDFVEEDSTS